MENKNEKTNLTEALCKAQSIMSGAKKDKVNPFFKSKYADLASVFEAINQPFTMNGLAVTQILDVLESGRMVIITKLLHVSGESIESKMILPDIADPQKMGSAISYMRRYSLMAIAGIPAEDDDGNSASSSKETIKKETLSKKEVQYLENLIKDNDYLKQMINNRFNGKLESMSQAQYKIAVNMAMQDIKNNEVLHEAS